MRVPQSQPARRTRPFDGAIGPWLGALAVLLAGVLGSPAQAQCNPHQSAKLVGSDGACGLSGCRQGYSVALSADGNTALMGAQDDNLFTGAAYVFVRSGSTWVQQGPKLTAIGGLGANQYFGCSVALSADGNTALIGAYGDTASLGAVYVFVRSGTTWSQQGLKLIPIGVVGGLEYFGYSVSLSADGNTALIGARGDNGYIGAAYIFSRIGILWTQQARLLGAGGLDANQYFGSSVALSADGNTAAVGALGDNGYLGASYFFVRSGLTWVQQGPKITPALGVSIPQYFGSAVALSANGNIALIGAYGDNDFVGAVYNFNRYGAVWLQQQKFRPVGGAGPGRYGSSVGITADGATAIVGAPNDDSFVGAGYVCVHATGGGWSQPGPKLVATGNVGPGTMGFSAAMSSTGLRGATPDNAALGAAYVFVRGLCPADFNCSGTLEVQDIFDYLNAWFALDPRADFNGVGGITVQDIFDYLSAWFAGC